MSPNKFLSVFEDPITFLTKQLSNLSPSQRNAYLSLSHHAVNTGDSQLYLNDTILSVLQTNAINAGPDKVGIFPNTARLNHGCVHAFNAVYSFRAEEKVLGMCFVFVRLW